MLMMIRDMEIREEGIEEGKLLGAVETLRDLGMEEEKIIQKIMEKYGLTRDEANDVVFASAARCN